MTDYRDDFKKRRFGFGNIEEGRALRAEKYQESRKQRRTQHFSRHRNLEIATEENNTPVKPQVDRRERLLKWKQEREIRNKLKKRKQKPAFKVGIVHHKLYSPAFQKNKINKSTRNISETNEIPKRITRATEKRLAEKAAVQSAKNLLAEKNKELVKSKKTEIVDKKPKESFAPEGYQFKPPVGLPVLPLFGTITLEDKRLTTDFFDWSLLSSKKKKQQTEQRIETSAQNLSALNKKSRKSVQNDSVINKNAETASEKDLVQKRKLRERSETPRKKNLSEKRIFSPLPIEINSTEKIKTDSGEVFMMTLRNRSISVITPKKNTLIKEVLQKNLEADVNACTTPEKKEAFKNVSPSVHNAKLPQRKRLKIKRKSRA